MISIISSSECGGGRGGLGREMSWHQMCCYNNLADGHVTIM